jgi:hypothetical protein
MDMNIDEMKGGRRQKFYTQQIMQFITSMKLNRNFVYLDIESIAMPCYESHSPLHAMPCYNQKFPLLASQPKLNDHSPGVPGLVPKLESVSALMPLPNGLPTPTPRFPFELTFPRAC